MVSIDHLYTLLGYNLLMVLLYSLLRYRARVLSETEKPGTFLFFCIDHGITFKAKSITAKKIPEDLANIEPLAVKCSLYNIDCVINNTLSKMIFNELIGK